MKLLTFAHRGEAQIFLKEWRMKPVSSGFEGLYRNSDFYLLLMGEGRQKATEKVAATLSQFQEITHVFNLGVCGSLRDEYPIDDIYSIRSVYGENEGKMLFKSFSSSDENAKVDLVSTSSRILEEADTNSLDNYAPLVDREAWAVGSCCQMFKKPLFIYKLISDRVGKETEVCQVVKERAEEFSDRLFQFFMETQMPEEEPDILLPEIKGLYFTVSQTRKLNYLHEKLSLKGIEFQKMLELANYPELLEMDIRPKDRAKIFLERLHLVLSPKQKEILATLDELSQGIEKAGMKTHFDSSLEGEYIGIHGKIENQAQINQLIGALEEFPFPKFLELIRGKDV